jgi:hypothetical protein
MTFAARTLGYSSLGIQYVNSASFVKFTTNPYTFTYTPVQAGNYLAIFTAVCGAESPTPSILGLTGYTAIASTNSGSVFCNLAAYQVPNVPAGSTTYSVTNASSASPGFAYVIEYSGVDYLGTADGSPGVGTLAEGGTPSIAFNTTATISKSYSAIISFVAGNSTVTSSGATYSSPFTTRNNYTGVVFSEDYYGLSGDLLGETAGTYTYEAIFSNGGAYNGHYIAYGVVAA